MCKLRIELPSAHVEAFSLSLTHKTEKRSSSGIIQWGKSFSFFLAKDISTSSFDWTKQDRSIWWTFTCALVVSSFFDNIIWLTGLLHHWNEAESVVCRQRKSEKAILCRIISSSHRVSSAHWSWVDFLLSLLSHLSYALLSFHFVVSYTLIQ